MSRGSSTPPPPEATGELHRRGLTRRGERMLDIGGSVVVALFAAAWVWSIANARDLSAAQAENGEDGFSGARRIAAALTSPGAPSTAYMTDAALTALTSRIVERERGLSGKLQATIRNAPYTIPADSLPSGAQIQYKSGGEVAAEPKRAGVWNVILTIGNAVRPSSFNVITMLPFSAKKDGRVGLYYVGNWPSEGRTVGPKKAPPGSYGNPAGFIEVTAENADTHLSEHFKLRDFLTHDQPNVWPKMLVLQPKLVDKLELVLSDLSARGVDVSGVKVMSGFRTPRYNSGGGNTAGRANLSRHMYGDASDIYIDSNGDGQMDDLNHDGKVSIEDSRVISAAVDRVEAAHPELVGGAGVYTAAPGHGPFIHIDTRGYRARWMGTSGG